MRKMIADREQEKKWLAKLTASNQFLVKEASDLQGEVVTLLEKID